MRASAPTLPDPAGPPRTRAGRRGLTLLELMVALLIVGFLLALTPPTLNGLSAKWRLRAAGREIESTALHARTLAVSRGVRSHLKYDVPEGLYWIALGDERVVVKRLPKGVRFRSVRFGDVGILYDVADLRAFPDGTVDSHQVDLVGGGAGLRLTFDRLTGAVSYKEF